MPRTFIKCNGKQEDGSRPCDLTPGTLSRRLGPLAHALGAQDALRLQNRRKRSGEPLHAWKSVIMAARQDTSPGRSLGVLVGSIHISNFQSQCLLILGGAKKPVGVTHCETQLRARGHNICHTVKS